MHFYSSVLFFYNTASSRRLHLFTVIFLYSCIFCLSTVLFCQRHRCKNCISQQPLTRRRLSGSASVRMQLYVLTLLFVNMFNHFVSSLYFHIGDTERKCFIEEIPDDTVLVGEVWNGITLPVS